MTSQTKGEFLRTRIESAGVLTYQTHAIIAANEKKSFQGARVLEIGGHNIPATVKFDILGAEKWICCDLVRHGSGNYQKYSPHPNSEHEAGVVPFNEIKAEHITKKSLFAVGNAADLPKIFLDKFDLILSIAAFEHINRLPRVLQHCYDALLAGGLLFSHFSPIWSARGGHHLNDPRVTKFNALGGWDHLLLSQPEMYSNLIIAGLDDHMAAHTVAWVYNSESLNRLFFEDYEAFMRLSPFSNYECRATGLSTDDEILLGRLKSRHPPYKNFTAYGITISAWK